MPAACNQAHAAEPALPGRRGGPPGGLRPDTNGAPFAPAEGPAHWGGAACKARRRRFGGER
jgi:hypothetical protein